MLGAVVKMLKQIFFPAADKEPVGQKTAYDKVKGGGEQTARVKESAVGSDNAWLNHAGVRVAFKIGGSQLYSIRLKVNIRVQHKVVACSGADSLAKGNVMGGSIAGVDVGGVFCFRKTGSYVLDSLFRRVVNHIHCRNAATL